MRRWRRAGLAVAAAAAGGVLGFVRLPLYALGPGSAHDVLPLIRVEGHPEYRTQGRLVMTTIAFRQLTAVGALAAWVDPAWSVVSRRELFGPAETEEQEERRARSEMDRSKVDAISVVLSEVAGYPERHGRGALVEAVAPGCPAAGQLFPGDLVVTIEGEPVEDVAAASRIIAAAEPGEPLTFGVRAGGSRTEVRLTRERCAGAGRPVVGVVLVENFPFRVRIASGPVGGPSAGLMWALGLYDLLTPGDLTGGRTVAGTGSIDLEGAVGGVGGVGAKVRAARKAGADVFLVPWANAAEARAAAGGLLVVPVASFEEAVRYLEGAPARDGDR